MKQLITGFSKWTERYISTCSGQRNHFHQTKRMKKWGDILNRGTGFDDSFYLERVKYRRLAHNVVEIKNGGGIPLLSKPLIFYPLLVPIISTN